MEKRYAFEDLVPRVRYYLLDFKDQHMIYFEDTFGTARLRDLTHEQLNEAMLYAFEYDKELNKSR